MPPTVSYSIGMTLHLGNPANNEYIKKNLEVKDFEVIPGETQEQFVARIQDVHSTFKNLSEWAETQLADEIEKALGTS